MKKYIYISIVSVIMIVLLFIWYDNRKNLPAIKTDENIIKITISIDGGDKLLKTTESQSQISAIVNHINGLHLKRTFTDVDEYSGSAFVLKVYFDDNSMKEFVEYGNMFFKESGKAWYRIPYEEADKFGSFYNNLGN